MTKHAGQEGRQRNIGGDAPGQRDQVRTESDFSDIEFAMKVGAVKTFLYRHHYIIYIAAFNIYPAFEQRTNPVIIQGGDRNRQSHHYFPACLCINARNLIQEEITKVQDFGF
jgi:hypothetical protein